MTEKRGRVISGGGKAGGGVGEGLQVADVAGKRGYALIYSFI